MTEETIAESIERGVEQVLNGDVATKAEMREAFLSDGDDSPE